MRFHKYHALGNDYIVLSPGDFPAWEAPDPARIRLLCHRHFGVGSDGILWGPVPCPPADFGLRIFNPDGSEAEKSGNGLRIFARYLRDAGLARGPVFTVGTPGGIVRVEVDEASGLIATDMGVVSFSSAGIPVAGPVREVLRESLESDGRRFEFSAATVGNPHCVILTDEALPDLAHRHGPGLETHALFPNRTNVQFLQVLDRRNLRIEIWERGAGYTLASGTSATACAAVARRLGLADGDVSVHMPGGTLRVEIGGDYAARVTGPATRVADGVLDSGLLESAGSSASRTSSTAAATTSIGRSRSERR